MNDLIFIILCIIISFVFGYLFCYVVLRSHYTKNDYDGTLSISQENASQIHTLEITTEPEDLKNKDRIVFKVRKVPTPEL